MALDNFFANGQANAGTGIFIAGVQPLEDNKNSFGIFLFYANAIVLYRKYPFVYLILYRWDVDLERFLAAELNGIAN